MPNVDPTDYRVLVVDDETPLRKLLARVLSGEGYQVSDTGDPNEAATLLDQQRYDVILSDYLMPGMDGLELLTLAREKQPDALRFILTGQADLSMAIHAINDGAIYRFLTKPVTKEEILVSIRLACEKLALARENTRLEGEVAKRDDMLSKIERQHPGITAVRRTRGGAIIIDEDDL